MATSDDGTPKKGRQRRVEKNDPSRFQGAGVNFKAKIIGIDSVQDARGDKMCQESIQSLKTVVKVSGEHKQRVIINVSLVGIKIMEEKTGTTIHHHPVHKISFIARDVTDARAFGYIYGPGDGTHKFFGIKTDKAAEGLVLALRDLFQVVFEMKKREVEEAKKLKEENKENFDDHEGKAKSEKNALDQKPKQSTQMECSETPQGAEAVGDLLNLENDLRSIEQGLQQMNAYGGLSQPPNSPASSTPGRSAPGGWEVGSPARSATGGWGGSGVAVRGTSPWGTPPGPMGTHVASTGAVAQFPVHFDQSPGDSQPPQSVTTAPTSQASPQMVAGDHSVRETAESLVSLQRPNSIPQGQQPGPAAAPSWTTFDSPSPPGAFAEPQKTAGQSSDPFGSPASFPVAGEGITQGPFGSPVARPVQGAGTQMGGPFGTPKITSSLAETQPQNQSFESGDFRREMIFSSSTPNTGTVAVGGTDRNKFAAFEDLSHSSLSDHSAGSTSNPFSSSSPSSSAAVNLAFQGTPVQPVSPGPLGLEDMPSGAAIKADTDDTAVHQTGIKIIDGQGDAAPATGGTKTLLALAREKQLETGTDPFGGPVSPLPSASGPKAANIDPFDTSAVLLAPTRGPFDTSQLMPFPVDPRETPTKGTAPGEEIQNHSSLRDNSHESSPESYMPSPAVPPPPLPKKKKVPTATLR